MKIKLNLPYNIVLERTVEDGKLGIKVIGTVTFAEGKLFISDSSLKGHQKALEKSFEDWEKRTTGKFSPRPFRAEVKIDRMGFQINASGAWVPWAHDDSVEGILGEIFEFYL